MAALVTDKRGVGESTGDWRVAGLDELVGDAAAAVAALRARPEIDPVRVGIHGHSQGGTIAAAAAVASGAAFVIASAPSGVPMDELEIYSLEQLLGVDGLPTEEAGEARDYVRAVVATAYRGAPRAPLEQLRALLQSRSRGWAFPLPPADHHYWSLSRRFADFAPLQAWGELRAPALVVFGERDERVPARESARRIAAAYLQGGGTALTVHLFPDADHTFRLPQQGDWPQTAPGYPDRLVAWVRALGALPGAVALPGSAADPR